MCSHIAESLGSTQPFSLLEVETFGKFAQLVSHLVKALYNWEGITFVSKIPLLPQTLISENMLHTTKQKIVLFLILFHCFSNISVNSLLPDNPLQKQNLGKARIVPDATTRSNKMKQGN